MSTKQHNLYRVYDQKNNYIQTYSSEIAEGFKWAKDCASRMNGRVDEITKSDTGETVSTVFDVSLKSK
jgi:hypothetical protein